MQVFLLILRAENWVCDLKGVPKKLGVKTQISQKSIKSFGTLSMMHAKDALWTSLFFKIFFVYQNCYF